ncbi:MAG: HU family DNA-binding protein, partial [Salinisphaera sp.]|nr:HU family DNA-binding protein [Salinisphaera sp.]
MGALPEQLRRPSEEGGNQFFYFQGEAKRNMNKSDLIDAVAADADLSKADAARAVDAVFDSVTRALKQGNKVSLVGFGVFS